MSEQQGLAMDAAARGSDGRAWETEMLYFNRDAPRHTVQVEHWGEWDGVISFGGPNGGMKPFPATIVDARTHLPGGKGAWTLEENGFCFVDRPAWDFPDHKDHDRKKCDAEFGPLVCEVARQASGARRAFWMSHQRRAEPDERYSADGYATSFGHSDYGPEFERQVRTILVHRYQMEEEEARTCGLMMVNMWAPVQRPAYDHPLVLLDGSSLDLGVDGAYWKLDDAIDNGYAEKKQRRPLEERVPVAAKDAPALAPLYSPGHRWVCLPDMQPTEGVIFKQYDFRQSSKDAGHALATFHCSAADPYHRDTNLPGRRSIECRVILTFEEVRTLTLPLVLPLPRLASESPQPRPGGSSRLYTVHSLLPVRQDPSSKFTPVLGSSSAGARL